MNDMEWADDALCIQIGGDPFFPLKGESHVAAKRICQVCPVQTDCLRWALDTGANSAGDGILGGMSPSARRRLKITPTGGTR